MDSDGEKSDSLSDRIRKAEAKSSGADKPDEAVSVAGSRVGFDFVGAVVGSGVLGAILDYSFGTSPWCLIGMIIIGFGIGISSAWRDMQKSDGK